MFARVSRAVRLTLILEARLEAQILAYRNGDFAALDEAGTRSAARARFAIGVRRATPATGPTAKSATATPKAANSTVCPPAASRPGSRRSATISASIPTGVAGPTRKASSATTEARSRSGRFGVIPLRAPLRTPASGFTRDSEGFPHDRSFPKSAFPAKAGTQCSSLLQLRPDKPGPRFRGGSGGWAAGRPSGSRAFSGDDHPTRLP